MFRVGNLVERVLFVVFLLAVLGVAVFWISRLPLKAAPAPTQGNRSDAPSTIRGQVRFQGETIPQPTVIENATDPQFCGSRHSFEDILISKTSRGIQNVIVALSGGQLSSSSRPTPKKLTLDNRDCRFKPHVAVLPAGSPVEAVNSDPIFHTTHLYYGSLSRNLALAVGDKASQLLSRPGFVIVKCDIHGWMKAFIRVDNHLFHAVSDAEGRFQILDVPPDSYTLEVWHESLGEQKLPITVRPGTAEYVEIEYSK